MSEILGPKSEGEQPIESKEGFIDPEKILTPEEIKWCEEQADLDNVQREFSQAFRRQWNIPDGQVSLSEFVVAEEKLNQPIVLEDWTLASSAGEKQKTLEEILPGIKITIPLSELEPEEVEKKYYHRQPISEYRTEDPRRHLLPVIIARDKARFTFQDIFDRESKRGNVVALDTMVYYPNLKKSAVKPELYFGKPKNHDEAVAMINAAVGKEITVVTGIVAVGEVLKGFLKYVESKAESKIILRGDISDEEIEQYVRDHWDEVSNSSGGIDYAGAGAKFIEKMSGPEGNLKGAPKEEIYKTIAKLHLIQLEINRQLQERRQKP